jgi:hypothetical protein
LTGTFDCNVKAGVSRRRPAPPPLACSTRVSTLKASPDRSGALNFRTMSLSAIRMPRAW